MTEKIKITKRQLKNIINDLLTGRAADIKHVVAVQEIDGTEENKLTIYTQDKIFNVTITEVNN